MTFALHALLVARRNWTVWKRWWKASTVGILGEPVFYVVAFGYGLGGLIGREVEGMAYIEYVGLALPLVAATTAASLDATYGAFTRMERQRTYHAIVATPVSIGEVVAGEIVWAGALGAISAAGTAVTLLVFGVATPGAAILAALPLAAAAGAVFGAAGLVATGLARTYDHFQYFHAVAVGGALLLSGAFFPLSTFAPPLAAAATWLPLAPPIGAVRALARGEPAGLAACLAILVLWLVPLAAVAAAVIRRRVLR